MTMQAIDQLWNAEIFARAAQNDYWRVANELLEARLVTIEDVATIWGIHPQTALKRLKAWRDRVPARHVDNLED